MNNRNWFFFLSIFAALNGGLIFVTSAVPYLQAFVASAAILCALEAIRSAVMETVEDE